MIFPLLIVLTQLGLIGTWYYRACQAKYYHDEWQKWSQEATSISGLMWGISHDFLAGEFDEQEMDIRMTELNQPWENAKDQRDEAERLYKKLEDLYPDILLSAVLKILVSLNLSCTLLFAAYLFKLETSIAKVRELLRSRKTD